MSNLVKPETFSFLKLIWGVTPHAFRSGWIAFHLFLPAVYRLEHKQETFLPLFEGRVQGYYQIYTKLGQDWTGHAGRLQTTWTVFRDIFVVFLGITAPYMGITKATASPATFALGSLCILYSMVGSLIAHVYTANGENLCKPVVVDYWLQACDDSRGSGLWFWTIISLPAVWFVPSILSFLAFIISAAWDASQTASNSLVVYKALLLFGIAWAIIHGIMIVLTWLRIKDNVSRRGAL